MARAIDVMTLDEAIKYCEDIDACDSCKAEHLQLAEWLKELKRYREQPTIEADPVKHGKWEEFDCDYGGTPDIGYCCSECGHAEMKKYPYCNCGARMDGE